ncbi:uncharacterized protein LOC103830648 [Brassica rapa]|uniref:uncharacterized protein LOC103830648 n=1 Tax=Brassica campestris TaxID=3711 RepID=UPI0008734830|nr:uncharacterized protein LOC103830648 [Brassica rapa]XP_048592263.1 uncharacterized protein LOC111208606 [Brassica napus]
MLSCSYAVNCLANLNRICHVCIRYKVSTEALEQYIMLVFWFKSWLKHFGGKSPQDSAGDLLSCSYAVLDKTNSIDGTVREEVMFQSEVKKLQQEQFRPAEQVSISSQEMLQYIVLE